MEGKVRYRIREAIDSRPSSDFGNQPSGPRKIFTQPRSSLTQRLIVTTGTIFNSNISKTKESEASQKVHSQPQQKLCALGSGQPLAAEQVRTLSKRGEMAQVVRGSNPISATRLPLSRLGQPGSIPALMLPSGGMAARHRKGATAERFKRYLK
ncbi:hypothetical protein T265_08417 [Opisthorchis viverrini]|uniref:Uncharacterized protein n=1 Tax=Opisthorchis viverrini TaxID=6198 RepID=A0A075A8G8_OPIVI|nr:hypothetical protein T265_08417 [Opisthorchis viverrini]KER23764.1 hypothetical protein T265_08417 [Opisthorchis viverrini]